MGGQTASRQGDIARRNTSGGATASRGRGQQRSSRRANR